jgi:sirohydrochlorin cobaltochelatase
MKNGLILFAHGARDPRWSLPFEAVAERVRRAQPTSPVQLAFLEFMSPNLPQAGALLAAQGCTHIDVLPLFLGAGGHVRKDLPMLVEQLQSAHPGTTVQLHAAVGEEDGVVQAMAEVALGLVQGRPS